MTPQRELIFRSFFEMGRHVSVDELCDKVRQKDRSVGYSTVWRNLKLICRVGLAQEVNIGDGITRYDRITKVPHGHLFCLGCKKVLEFNVTDIVSMLAATANESSFTPEGFNIEVQGYCENCSANESENETTRSTTVDTKTPNRVDSESVE